jgi:hypothetical protein
MSRQARAAVGRDKLTVLADRGYFSGKQILACKSEGVIPYRGWLRIRPKITHKPSNGVARARLVISPTIPGLERPAMLL